MSSLMILAASFFCTCRVVNGVYASVGLYVCFPHDISETDAAITKLRNIDVCCWVFPADAFDRQFFRIWSFSQSASADMGHGAHEIAGFFCI